MTNKTKIAIALAILLWASAFVGIRSGLAEYSPEGLALLRYLIASICMTFVYFYLPDKKRIPFGDACGLLGLGAIGIGIYNLCLNYGEIAISSGMSSFIISQSPIITAVIAVIFFGEKLTLLRVTGFLISLIGVSLIASGEMGGFKWDISLTYIIAATLVSGSYSILQKPFLKKYSPIVATTYIMWGGTLFLALYTSKLQHDLSQASLSATLTVVYLGLFPAAVGYVAWSYALSEIPAPQAGSFLYFMPFVATLLGWLCLGEVPTLIAVIGSLFAIVGVWVVNHSYSRPRVAVFEA